MKLGKTHLQIALALVALSVMYNVWVFFFRAPGGTAQQSEVPLLSTVQRPARSGATGGTVGTAASAVRPGVLAAAAVDPVAIPAPPAFDTATAPAWIRDPLLAAGETRDPVIVRSAVVDPTPDVVISSILYSSTRRSAIVDRRVVGIGDAVGGGVIADIQPDAIVLRLPSGTERRIEMVRAFGTGVSTSVGARSK